MADSKKYDGSQWEHSLRKLGTATETIQSGDTIYANGQPITTYTLKGNEEHTGTPSPQNPVMPNGVGNKTANLCNPTPYKAGYYINAEGQEMQNNVFDIYSISATANQSYTISANVTLGGNTVRIHAYTNGTWTEQVKAESSGDLPWSFTAPTGCDEIRISITHNAYEHIMVNTGSTALPYEPYGYKIPILTAQQTIDIYIGDLPLLKSLDGTAVDEISNGTLTRRVDSDGSVLPTPTTTQITMPSIPTTEGANSITVDTTVQPSEFTATWTGWHDASVKEYDGSDWQ